MLSRYLLSLTDVYLAKGVSVIFTITYADGRPIDFSREAIGVLSSVRINNIPFFLEDGVLKRRGIDYNSSGFSFGPIEDEGKLWVEAGVVEFRVMEDKTQVSEKHVFELALDFARKSLEAVPLYGLKEKGFVDDAWIRQVQAAIPKLEDELRRMD